jgi:hypothetical protein
LCNFRHVFKVLDDLKIFAKKDIWQNIVKIFFGTP